VAQLDEMFNAILSDPGSMAQIMQLAQQLSGPSSSSQPPPQETVPPPPPPPSENNSLFSGIDPQFIGKLLPLLQDYSRSDSDTMQLLMALRPFLKPEKQDKIQRAARLARLIHIGKRFLLEWEA